MSYVYTNELNRKSSVRTFYLYTNIYRTITWTFVHTDRCSSYSSFTRRTLLAVYLSETFLIWTIVAFFAYAISHIFSGRAWNWTKRKVRFKIPCEQLLKLHERLREFFRIVPDIRPLPMTDGQPKRYTMLETHHNSIWRGYVHLGTWLLLQEMFCWTVYDIFCLLHPHLTSYSPQAFPIQEPTHSVQYNTCLNHLIKNNQKRYHRQGNISE